MHHGIVNQPPAKGHLGCFTPVAVTGNMMINNVRCVLLYSCGGISSRYFPRGRIAESEVIWLDTANMQFLLFCTPI